MQIILALCHKLPNAAKCTQVALHGGVAVDAEGLQQATFLISKKLNFICPNISRIHYGNRCKQLIVVPSINIFFPDKKDWCSVCSTSKYPHSF